VVLLVRPLTASEVLVSPFSFTTIVVKLEEVETWSPYEAAPLEAFQVSVGLVEIPVAAFDGEESVGAGGGLTAVAVVKLHVPE
jgi:hypothetical protein